MPSNCRATKAAHQVVVVTKAVGAATAMALERYCLSLTPSSISVASNHNSVADSLSLSLLLGPPSCSSFESFYAVKHYRSRSSKSLGTRQRPGRGELLQTQSCTLPFDLELTLVDFLDPNSPIPESASI